MAIQASAKYYQKKTKKRVKKKSRDQNLTEEEKSKNIKYDRERCRNLSEDEKQRLAEYRNRYSDMQKNN